MELLDLTFETAAENLACDEVLLDWCDSEGGEVLRFWEPADWFVVVGHGNRVTVEVNQAACAAQGVGIYRRCSGGGTVLQGPGCLNYSLILQIPEAGPRTTVAGTNRAVMERHCQAIREVLNGVVEVCGHTDLTLGGHKFSGNAQRRKRHALLFHGTFLHSFDLAMVPRFLAFPSRQPEYRQGRSHEEFLANLPLFRAQIQEQLQRAWDAEEPIRQWPITEVRRLAVEKYETEAWNLRH